jgi:hypothetical protein
VISSLQDLSSGNVESFRIAIAFAGGFAGKKNIYTAATNHAGASTGYQLEGNWTVTASSADHRATLNWNASATPLVTYNVYRSSVSGGPYSKINPSAVSALSYVDTAVAAGKTYYYVVTAVNSSNVESGYSNEATAPIPSD